VSDIPLPPPRQWPWKLAAALAIALWVELFFTIGWTFAACTPVSGTNYGFGESAYGLPFPYFQWSSVSSMEYGWIPWIFALNVVLLTLAAWPLVRWLSRRLRRPQWGWLALALLVAIVAIQAMRINTFLVFSTDAFRGGEFDLALTDLRPAALYFGGGSYECTPSPFWFPEHR
jgi:hypothetical protein